MTFTLILIVAVMRRVDFQLASGMSYRSSKWGFPKIGDPNIVPEIVGSLL